MNVIKISPRGFCYGVVTAIKKTIETLEDANTEKPVHILGMIVHNEFLTKALENKGAITINDKNKNRIELLDQVNRGTVIFTAHGISPEVYKKAIEKGLNVIDASCPDVLKTHQYIQEKVLEGYDIIYIGKKNHPEPEGAIGINPEKVHLVETSEDIQKLNIDNDKISITNQTTMSLLDIYYLVEEIQKYYPNAEIMKEVCNATQVRQEAVAEFSKLTDLILVVGDPKSNNTSKLVQIAEKQGSTKAFRIANVADIKVDWLMDIENVGVTSGASTPTKITQEVIEFLENFDKNNKATWNNKSKLTFENILPKF